MEISHRLSLFMCPFFFHPFNKVSTYVKYEGEATQICVEKIEFFFSSAHAILGYDESVSVFQ